MLKTYNERTAFELSVDFTGKDGNPEAPSEVNFRIIDEAGGEIAPWTTVSPIGATTVIPITSAGTSIVDVTQELERRSVIVRAEYASDADLLTLEYPFQVRNLHGIPETT